MLVPIAITVASFTDVLAAISPDTFVYSANIEAPPPHELDSVTSVWFDVLLFAS
jgi:hypothetical protein